MSTAEMILFWSIAACYLITFVAAVFYAFFSRERLAWIAAWALWCGYALHLAFFVLLWVAYGHFPHHKPAIVTVTIFVVMQWWMKDRLAHIAIFASLIVLAAFLLGNTGDPSRPLSTAYHSRWLFLHIVSTWFAFGSFAVATAFAIAYLLKEKTPRFLPAQSLADMDQVMHRLIAVGTLFQALMLIAGSMWAKKLFGRYWGWDHIEIWALMVFLFYILYIHARLLLHLQGRPAAWMLILGLVLMAISLWGLPFVIPNTHIQSPMESFAR